ncbi:MAG: hypothetical protein KJZ62_00145 [Fimbriimonadaceae bacterium]|nr:hypothetical protein [Fimbriimonadaceae bacterium]QOJ11240.1 MAG: hypothetical protein HRU74_03935 [Chthonomonadaceae bacterium]
MRKLVVILGAGASVSAGLPSLAGIFDDPSVQNYLENDGRDFKAFLEKHVWEPRGITPREFWKGLNLEEVLTLLRQWRFSSKPNGGKHDNPHSPLNHSKNMKIQRQLLGCVYRAVYEGKSGKSPEGRYDYNTLIQLADSEFDEVTWATFNWDALLEQAFYYTFYKQNRLPSCHSDLVGWDGADDKHRLLKLHGSVTWFYDTQGQVTYVPWGKTICRGDQVGEHWSAYLTSVADAPRPMIAEPSFFKHEDLIERPFLLRQWEMFDEAIAKANLVLIIGYSMPDGDAMAKQSLLTAVERDTISKFVVVDPDSTYASDGLARIESGVMQRYRRVLGSPRLTECKQTFGEFLDGHNSLLPLM